MQRKGTVKSLLSTKGNDQESNFLNAEYAKEGCNQKLSKHKGVQSNQQFSSHSVRKESYNNKQKGKKGKKGYKTVENVLRAARVTQCSFWTQILLWCVFETYL